MCWLLNLIIFQNYIFSKFANRFPSCVSICHFATFDLLDIEHIYIYLALFLARCLHENALST